MIKLRIFDLTEKISQNFIGRIYRNLGKRLVVNGLSLQGDLTSDDRLVPSLRCRQYKQQIPRLGGADFVAPNSVVVGNVQLGQNSSIWYGATLRGDQGEISIGQQSIIQDLVTIVPINNQSVKIGDNVLIGPNSSLESCQISNNAFIGMGSSIRKGAKINSNTVLAAGAVVAENQEIKTNQIWAGNPAQYLRDLTPEEQQVITEHHQETLELARIHCEETEKSFREIIDDLDDKETQNYEGEEAKLLREIKKLGFPMTYEDEDYIEQRVFLKEAKSPKESEFFNKNYDPYEQDLENFPDSFKVYGENYKRYDEINKFFEQNSQSESPEISQRFNPDIQPDQKPWTRKY